jgi:peptidoglycan/LPS O-acetylase OafA/YrhL
VKATWLAFSVQFWFLSPALVWISRRPAARSLLLYLALIPLIDAALMYYYVGPFIGAYIVSAGAILLLIGAWLLPPGEAYTS